MPELRPFQKVGVEFLRNRKRVILADEMGLGKTPETIVTCQQLKAKRVLIVSPNGLKDNWKNEFNTWAPEYTAVVTSGDEIDVLLQTTAALQYMSKFNSPTVVITNYERFIKIANDLDIFWDVIAFDEAHRLKNRKSLSYKAAKKLRNNSYYMYLITGTRILGKVEELWPLLSILYPKQFTAFTKFTEAFCEVSPTFAGHVKIENILDPNHPKIKKLQMLLSDKMIRRKTVDVLPELPEKTVTQINVEMGSKQRELYSRMEKEFLIEYEKEYIVAPIKIAQMTRLRQIAISPELLTDSNKELSGAKIEALLDLVDSAQGQKIIVFSKFETAIRKVYQFLNRKGFSCVKYTGKETDEEKSNSVNLFQLSDAQILLATIDAGGVGLNLTAGDIIIFLDKDWTPAINEQAQKRAHRFGRQNPVFVYELITNSTIEKDIEDILHAKKAAIAAVYGETSEPFERLPDIFDDLIKRIKERNNNEQLPTLL